MDYLTNNMNGGEWSPRLISRSDLEKYESACFKIENFTVLPYGGAESRPGTEFITETKTTGTVKLVKFQFNIEQAYMLEFGAGYIRFYMNGGQILTTGDVPYEIATPYQEADLADLSLRYTQSADLLYLCHPNHPQQQLMRYDHDDWDLVEVTFKLGAFKDDDITGTKLTPSATTGSITVSADADVFSADMVGGKLLIKHPNTTNAVNQNFSSSTTSSSITIYGTWQVETTGTWTGTLYLERSYDNGTSWVAYRQWAATDNRNLREEGTEEESGALYRMRYAHTSGTCKATLTCEDYWIKGEVKITGFTDAQNITADVTEQLASTAATADWAEGAWSPKNGYPAMCAFYGDRLVFARTAGQPQTYWLSVVGDYTNFSMTDLDDSAMSFTINDEQVNAIQWIIPRKGIMTGTSVGEGILKPTNKDEPLTPDNHGYDSETQNGSADMPALRINEVVLFVQRQGTRLLELSHSFADDEYFAPDLSLLAEHMLKSGLKVLDYQQLPSSIVWGVDTTGKLVGLTYKRDQKITAWHSHTTAGTFEDLCVLNTADDDEIWVVVKRGGKQMIERFVDRDFQSIEDAWCVDSGLKFDGGSHYDISGYTLANPGVFTATGHPFNSGEQVRITEVQGDPRINGLCQVVKIDADTFSLRDKDDTFDIDTSSYTAYSTGGKVQRVENILLGFDHLEGQVVDALIDGSPEQNLTVTGGQVTLPTYGNKIIVGTPFRPVLAPMPIEPGGGEHFKGTKRISHILFDFYQSRGGKFGSDPDDPDTWNIIVENTTSDYYDQAKGLFSGLLGEYYNEGFSTRQIVYVIQDQPLPITILSMSYNIGVYGSK